MYDSRPVKMTTGNTTNRMSPNTDVSHGPRSGLRHLISKRPGGGRFSSARHNAAGKPYPSTCSPVGADEGAPFSARPVGEAVESPSGGVEVVTSDSSLISCWAVVGDRSDCVKQKCTVQYAYAAACRSMATFWPPLPGVTATRSRRLRSHRQLQAWVWHRCNALHSGGH